MATNSDYQIASLEQLAAVLQRRLRILETKCARYGIDAPTHLIIEKEDVKNQLAEIRATLHGLHPDDADNQGFTNLTEPTIGATVLKRRSFRIYYLALGSCLVIGSGALGLGVGQLGGFLLGDWKTTFGITMVAFAFCFSIWYFSPVNNNSPSYRRYRKVYLRHLFYRHRDFDVKGLSTRGIYNLEQEHVFVSLELEPQPMDRISSGLIPKTPESLPAGDHDIWSYLKGRDITNQKFAIIGSPGSGKTTLLKHITLTYASFSNRRRHPKLPNRTPILLFLRDHAKYIANNPRLTLAQVIHQSLVPWRQPPPPGWFETELQRSRCVVLLDGLDEVADLKIRKQVVTWVERQMQIYPKNSFLITSRPLGYRSNPLTGVHVLEVRPFTSAQVRRFVENWYYAIEVMSSQKDDPGVRMRAVEGANDLLQRLINAAALTELAANPLLLTMIATIHRYRSRLPGRRVELYAEICEVFLGKRRQSFDLDLEIAPMQKQRVLQPLAYQMMKNQQREIESVEALQWIEKPLSFISVHMPGTDFLKMIEESSGLLLERESGIYSFAHQTFQEYLAAVYIQEQRLIAELIAQAENSWWHETILLYAARSDASPIVEKCIENDSPSINALVLTIGCLNEASEIQPMLRARAEKLLLEEVEDDDPQRQRIVAEALVTQRLRRMVRLNDYRYIDTALVTHAEYQLFLDEQRQQGRYYQPDHWSGMHFSPGQGHTPIAGIRPADADAFCIWLTQRERGGYYQLPLVEEGQVYTKETNSTTGYWVRQDRGFTCEGAAAMDMNNFKMALEHRIADDFINLRLYALLVIFGAVHEQARDLAGLRPTDRDLLEDQNRIRRLIGYLDLAHPLLLALVGTLDQGSAHELTIGLANARSLARTSAQDLATALEAARASASAQGPDPARASAQDQDRGRFNARLSDIAHASAISNTNSLANALTTFGPILQILKSALSADFVNNAELMNHFDPADMRTRKLLEAIVYGYEPMSEQLRLRLRSHIYIPDADQFRAFVRSHAFILDHAHALTCIDAFDRTSGERAIDRTKSTLQRAYLRYWALMCSALITQAVKSPPISAPRNLRGEQHKDWTKAQICYGFYIDLALLEERIEGNIPAVEGIRITKELPVGAEARH